jgi:hypothetical protein
VLLKLARRVGAAPQELLARFSAGVWLRLRHKMLASGE